MSSSGRGRRAPASAYDWQETRATESDFAEGSADNTSVSAGANPDELMYAEIGDDNGVSSQFSSYRAVRVGGSGGQNPRSGEGKINADMDSDESNTDTNQRTQLRWIKRPQNGDSRTILTQWYTLEDLEVSDVEDRVRLPPVTNAEGEPLVVRQGDVLAVEVRNPASSFTIDVSGSELTFPVQVGY